MAQVDLDRTGLIRESYAIAAISAEQCRSIFLDWALNLPVGTSEREAAGALLAQYSGQNPDHPMTEILRQAQSAAAPIGRRGGRRGRLSPSM